MIKHNKKIRTTKSRKKSKTGHQSDMLRNSACLYLMTYILFIANPKTQKRRGVVVDWRPM